TTTRMWGKPSSRANLPPDAATRPSTASVTMLSLVLMNWAMVFSLADSLAVGVEEERLVRFDPDGAAGRECGMRVRDGNYAVVPVRQVKPRLVTQMLDARHRAFLAAALP